MLKEILMISVDNVILVLTIIWQLKLKSARIYLVFAERI